MFTIHNLTFIQNNPNEKITKALTPILHKWDFAGAQVGLWKENSIFIERIKGALENPKANEDFFGWCVR